jgi:cytosine/adenosine deaminase-related metal-dependent hydrolase
MPEPLQPAPPRQLIHNAAWVVAWDEAAQSHVYRRDVDLTIEGDTVAAIGPAGPVDHADAVEIDVRGFAVLPGFVDIHAHPSSEPMLKGLTDEVGSRQLYMSSLYEYLPLFNADPEGRRAATEVALCELMQSGVTTVCDLSAAREDWLDTLGASGMRVYAAPMFRSGRWYTPNGREVRYTWDEQAGREGLDRALRVIDRVRQHPSGRLDGVLYPAQVDTCTEALLRDSAAAAREAPKRSSAMRFFSTIIPGCTGRSATTSPISPRPAPPWRIARRCFRGAASCLRVSADIAPRVSTSAPTPSRATLPRSCAPPRYWREWPPARRMQ